MIWAAATFYFLLLMDYRAWWTENSLEVGHQKNPVYMECFKWRVFMLK
jgi:hypothetical protein